MRLLLLTPGTGHFYCGSCLRDHSLARALTELGHDVTVAPLYLPLVLEEPPAAPPEAPVHMGGINMYLQQKARVFRYLPRFLANLLDRPGLLRWASTKGSMTEAPDLGPMTLSMLRGEEGRQAKELEKLVAWVEEQPRPDVVVLSNVMLSGTARRLKQALGRPIVVTLQGEAPFLDALPAPFPERAWQTLGERAADIDAFVSVSRSYGDVMCAKLGLAADRVRVVYNGIDLADFADQPAPIAERTPKTVGYLARMCRDKGVHTLVDAFLILAERDRVPDLRLHVVGVMLEEDRPLVAELEKKLAARVAPDRFRFAANVERAEKLAFLRSLSVFSVPATYGESFGLYLLEAMAAGVPVVQPRHAAFPEVLEATGGGILCEPDDAASLADGLERLLLDEDESARLARAGREAVLARFASERMAREFAAVCSDLAQ